MLIGDENNTIMMYERKEDAVYFYLLFLVLRCSVILRESLRIHYTRIYASIIHVATSAVLLYANLSIHHRGCV